MRLLEIRPADVARVLVVAGMTLIALACHGHPSTEETCGDGICSARESASTCPVDCGCGNGVLDADEACDGTGLAGQTCLGLGYTGGVLGCTEACQLDETGCTSGPPCGNGIRQGSEVCDGTDLAGHTCEQMGYAGGTLRCTDDCRLDLSACGWAIGVSAGPTHSCALRNDRTAWCWGDFGLGQLGNNDPDFAGQCRPDPVFDFFDAESIAAGDEHTCALRTDGSLWCWGSNHWGQLGNGTDWSYLWPGTVTLLDDPAISVSAGDLHSCAVTAEGTVWCWGTNFTGALGDGTLDDSRVPVQVVGLTDAVSVACGRGLSCAVLGDGTAWCWGENWAGQLGSGSDVGTVAPVPVANLTTVAGIAIRSGASCAWTDAGEAWCWGTNYQGALGTGTEEDSLVPVRVPGLSQVVSMAVGGGHACAAEADGSLWCWGANHAGALGDGSWTSSRVPVRVLDVDGVVEVTASSDHTCARSGDGRLWCWGDNYFRQLGDGTPFEFSHAVQAVGLSDALHVASSGEEHTCAATADGGVWCWGELHHGELGRLATATLDSPTAMTTVPPVTALTTGETHDCGLTSEGSLWCWGFNQRGQLGDGTVEPREDPVQVAETGPFVALGAGSWHTCAVKAEGSVWCWGDNYYGELGFPGTWDASSPSPLEVAGLTDVLEVAVGAGYSCSLGQDGQVRCWGDNYWGQLGPATLDASSAAPVEVTALTTATGIAAGRVHACAVLAEGSAVCWGSNDEGQLGDGQVVDRSDPVPVQDLDAVIALGCGRAHTCALQQDGSVWCWGANPVGQLGIGVVGDPVPRPARVDLPGLATELALGSNHSCARLEDGTVWCWGGSYYGQVGDGSSVERLRPFLISAP